MKNRTLTLVLILICFLTVYTIYLSSNNSSNNSSNTQVKKEDFKSTEIITSEMKENDDYRQCLDQNAQLYYQSHGKYSGCHQTLRDLTNWGMGPQTDLGFGQMKYVCPVSCLLKQPSDCLKAKADNQNTIILDISRDLRDFKANTPMIRDELNRGFLAHDQHLDQLYGKKHVQEVVDYIYTSGRQISDPTFQKILQDRTTVALGPNDQSQTEPTPTPELVMAYTKPPEIEMPEFGGFGPDNLNMNSSMNNTSNLLGF